VQTECRKLVFCRGAACFRKFLFAKLRKKPQNHYICTVIETLFKKYISNMTIQDAIRQRHSVRKYSDRPVEKEKLKALQALVDEYNQQSGLHIQLVTNDPTAFDSRMAHYGKFSGISNYLAMIGPKSDELLDEKGLFWRLR